MVCEHLRLPGVTTIQRPSLSQWIRVWFFGAEPQQADRSVCFMLLTDGMDNL